MVWHETVEISVSKKSETVWIASGEFLDQPYAFRGRTESQAVKVWTEAAKSLSSRRLGALLTNMSPKNP